VLVRPAQAGSQVGEPGQLRGGDGGFHHARASVSQREGSTASPGVMDVIVDDLALLLYLEEPGSAAFGAACTAPDTGLDIHCCLRLFEAFWMASLHRERP